METLHDIVPIVAAAISIAVVLIGWGKTTGSVTAGMTAIGATVSDLKQTVKDNLAATHERIEKVEEQQDQQWSAIRNLDREVGYLSGAAAIKSRAKSAGAPSQ